SGRIADIVIHPEDNNTWYVAVGSGGVWKTTNSGITWKPIFDSQSSYSIGCVAVAPNNPHVIWVGTGENVGGRHVGYGDGIYRSEDAGTTWKNMGLKESFHISKIIIHPDNSNILWVAAQGSQWSKGGQRGLYKSKDKGKNWKQVLGDNEWVGVTDIVIDPRDPNRLYAATWQRHRSVAAYMGGGPGTAIYCSIDGGDNWKKLTNGLPKSDMGKIGLAISPQKPDVVYAVIEFKRRTGGLYKSLNRGASWQKQSDAVSGDTGPHYYQELYACPHKFDRLYLIDARMQISEDGGKTFRRMKRSHRHRDDHAIAFRKDDPDYLLVGSNGGLYETFELEENWRYIQNLPITQFYKVTVDDAEPFYNIYGGTQDNSTQGGPSRTDNVHGIQNSDWRVTLGGDGHQPATEPGNPAIIYCESQEGYLYRVDCTTGETVFIQPQPEAGEGFERFNWDAPILVSPHSPTRLYFASQRVWRSENRGDSWTAISTDLTRNQERLSLPIGGKNWSWDSPWDISAMSTYNTITSLAESPRQEGLIYAGTDDGLIQITENGRQNWRKVEVGSLPGVPKTAFINDIKADLYDADTAYIVLDNHKFGDLNPYLLKSTDRGKSWSSIRGNIPGRTLVWRLVQDHVKASLMFAGTEFGIYFTIDGGSNWIKISGGAPTISFRDLGIQRRENDLVGASFGRGFFVFDDYSVLRHVSPTQLKEATLFPTRKTWWYIPRRPLGGRAKGTQGASHFTAPNPPFGAVFTYYLPETLKTKKEVRREMEKKLVKQNKSVTFPGWEQVEVERRQQKPVIWLTIKDSGNKVVRRIKGPVTKGFHRVNWDLRYPTAWALDAGSKPGDSKDGDFLVNPGKFTVSLSYEVDGTITGISKPASFSVVPLRKGALPGTSPEEYARFREELTRMLREASAASLTLRKALKKVEVLKTALERTPAAPGELDKQLFQIRESLLNLDQQLNGNPAKDQVGEKTNPTFRSRMFAAMDGSWSSTYGPTPTHKRSLEIAKGEFVTFKSALDKILLEQLPELEKALYDAGAPMIK
ncbi:glycosyl hydrolase, partial [Acidobacteriota bacterium]